MFTNVIKHVYRHFFSPQRFFLRAVERSSSWSLNWMQLLNVSMFSSGPDNEWRIPQRQNRIVGLEQRTETANLRVRHNEAISEQNAPLSDSDSNYETFKGIGTSMCLHFYKLVEGK
jgi:hypothetical protein